MAQSLLFHSTEDLMEILVRFLFMFQLLGPIKIETNGTDVDIRQEYSAVKVWVV